MKRQKRSFLAELEFQHKEKQLKDHVLGRCGGYGHAFVEAELLLARLEEVIEGLRDRKASPEELGEAMNLLCEAEKFRQSALQDWQPPTQH